MWVAVLDRAVQIRIRARLVRFTAGNLGDHKPLMDGLWEARITFGPGYRI
jgi:putative addiction module killer protein